MRAGMYRAMPSDCGRMRLHKLAQRLATNASSSSSSSPAVPLDVGIYKNVNPRVKNLTLVSE